MISIASLEYGIIFLLLASKPSHSKDGDYRNIDGNLISRNDDITEQVTLVENGLNQKTSVDTLDAKNDYSKIEDIFTSKMNEISNEIKGLQLFVKPDCREIEEDLISTVKDIRSENEGLKKNLNEVNTLVKTLSVTLDLLMRNQDSVQLKSEKSLVKLEEKLAEDISEAAKSISLEVSSCKEKLFGFETFSNGPLNLETNKRGMKNFCINFPKSTFLIAKAFFYTNISTYSFVDEDFKKCWEDFYKNLNGLSIFITPRLKGNEFTGYCQKYGGEPFIPRTQEEFIIYIAVAIIKTFVWYPINDLKEEGHVVLHDGTDYENSNYKPEKWSPFYKNDNYRDCVKVNLFGEASWDICGNSKLRGICLRK